MKRLQLLLPLLGLFFLPTVTSASVLDEPNPTNTRLVAGPTITQCPSNLTLNVGSSCDAVVPNMLATFQATDNCATPTTLTYAQSPIAGTILSGHGTVLTVVFTVTDNCGQSAMCSATVTVKDRDAPIFMCPPSINIALNAGTVTLNASILGLSASDNCTASNAIVFSFSQSTFTCANIYAPINVKITGTDLAGNFSSCMMNMTIEDKSNFCPPPPPTITQCPINKTLNIVSSTCDIALPNMLSLFQATSNCPTSATLTFAQSPIAGTVLSGHGTTQNVVFTATDNCGQSSNCTAIITLRDVRAPEILVHDKVVELARGQATITINDVLNVVQDNCTPSNLITLQLSRTVFTCVDLISSPVSIKLTATDAAGNINFVNVSITVQDNMNDCTIVPLTGKIKTESGVGISNVQVVLKHLGTPITTLTTDATGNYSLNVVENTNFTLEMTKNTNISNGVTVADANAISNHIANTPALSSPYKVLAANVTEDDGSGSAVGFTDLTDPILVQQLATGVITTLPVQSWIFVPANHVFNTPSPANAFPSPLPIRPLLINVAIATVFDVIGIKKGDVNGDADPNQ